MTLYNFKPLMQRVIRPVNAWMVEKKVSPNILTWAGFACSVLIGLSLYLSSLNPVLFFIIPILSFLRIFFNVLDGMVARSYNHLNQAIGKFAHEIFDRMSDIVLFLFLSFTDGIHTNLGLLALTCILFANFVGVLSDSSGSHRRFEGIMGKPERMVLLSCSSIVCGFSGDIYFLDIFLLVLICGSVLTSIIRISNFYRDMSIR